MLDRFPSGLVACVSDSYDVLRACREHWGKALRDRVLERDGTLVVRPDSGDPPEIVIAVLEALADAFGSERNAKGYRVLTSASPPRQQQMLVRWHAFAGAQQTALPLRVLPLPRLSQQRSNSTHQVLHLPLTLTSPA